MSGRRLRPGPQIFVAVIAGPTDKVEVVVRDLEVLAGLIGKSPNLVIECAVEMLGDDRSRVRAVHGYVIGLWNTECDRGFCSGRKN